eukprot:GHUV01004777.1.p1 GENE.GHUV01004777.1~~GHUV01004777.1.p1  ORF type:complete len:243 (+),score=69.95 GHUV01004777.1:209-937(+)
MTMMKVVVLASLLFAITAAEMESTWIKGTASFTGLPHGTEAGEFNAASVKAVPNGACGYGTLTSAQYPFFMVAGVAAKNPITQSAQKGCGTCLEVQCVDDPKSGKQLCDNNTPVTVMVYDTCDECEANQINLYATAFSRMANLEVGRVDIQYREVSCPFTGGINVYVDAFRPEQGGFLKLALRNVAGTGGIKSVALRTTGNTANNWRQMKNTYGAVWEGSQLSTLPLDIQVTKTDGQTVVLR